MKMVYIASPLRGDVEENIKKANAYCRQVAENGGLPFAPHCVFSQYLDDNIPQERELGMKMGLEFLSRCDELLIFGNRISEGMMQEIKKAFLLGIPIRHHDKNNRLTNRLANAQLWLKLAVQCFEVSDYLQSMKELPVEAVCHRCQEVVQNLLYSCVFAVDAGHLTDKSISELLDKCLEINPKFNEISSACDFLTGLGKPLYPSERKLTVQDMQTALAHSGEIHKFILDIVPELAIDTAGQEQMMSMNEPTM